MMVTTRRATWLAAALLAAQCAGTCSAQGYPARNVRMIVASSAGTGADTFGRIVARGMSRSLGRQVAIENRAGGAGNIGTELAAKAPADGYTLLLVTTGHVANSVLSKSLPYDLLRDFAPITQIASSPSVLVVHPSAAAKSLPELVERAKGRPGDIAYSSAGIGTPSFVAGELFNSRAGIKLLHVPYRSGAEAVTAVLTGEVAVYFASLAGALPFIRQGRLRPLAVTSRKRVPVLRDQPTVAESGYPGYEAGNWYGLAVPAGTAAEIIASIRGAVLNALRAPDTSKALAEHGYLLIGDEPEDFSAHIEAEIDKLTRILRDVRSR